MTTDPLLKYREQHKHRLNYMPWLYWSLKPKHREWAEAWQAEYQAYLMEMETIEIGKNCFISPLAHIFAERGRKITIGDNTFIAADCTLHGPLQIGDGGAKRWCAALLSQDTSRIAPTHANASSWFFAEIARFYPAIGARKARGRSSTEYPFVGRKIVVAVCRVVLRLGIIGHWSRWLNALI